MRPNSLAFRLIAAASLWSARRARRRRPDPHLALSPDRRAAPSTSASASTCKTLVGTLAAQNPRDAHRPRQSRRTALRAALFRLVLAGAPTPTAVRWCSPRSSLFTDILDIAKATGRARPSTASTTGALTGPDDQALRVLSRTIDLRGPATASTSSSPATPARWQTRSPRSARSVVLTLAVFGIGLILATTIQIRWGLRPLDRVRRGLADSGAARRRASRDRSRPRSSRWPRS